MAPGLGIFFTYMTIAEGGGRRAIQRKFQDVYVPALKANYIVWPAVQILNFRIIPLQYQIVSLERQIRLLQIWWANQSV
jgi:protein Mpv17